MNNNGSGVLQVLEPTLTKPGCLHSYTYGFCNLKSFLPYHEHDQLMSKY